MTYRPPRSLIFILAIIVMALPHFASADTWKQVINDDINDFWCPLTDPSRAYGGTTDCPAGIQEGDTCSSPGSSCKVNTIGGGNGSGCYINTDIYHCQSSGQSCTPQQTSPGGCTQTGSQWGGQNSAYYSGTKTQQWGPQASSCMGSCQASGSSFCSQMLEETDHLSTRQYSCWSSASDGQVVNASPQTTFAQGEPDTRKSYSLLSYQPVYSCTTPTYGCVAAPDASISANPISITQGSTSSLTYSCTNATSASIDQGVGAVNATAESSSVTVTPSTNTTYTLTCTGSGGSATAFVTVAVTPPAITASCSVSPTSINAGQSATWTAVASGGTGTYTYSWSGTDSLSGSGSSVSKTYSSTGTKTASVTVTSGGDSSTVQCSNSLSVGSSPPPPTPSLSCSPSASSVNIGDSVTYTVTASGGATGPYSWLDSDGWTGTGSSVSRSYSTGGTYAMSVAGGNVGTTYCSPQVAVASNVCSGAPTITILANPSRVRAGSTSTITWSASNIPGASPSCTISGPGVSQNVSASAPPSCNIPNGSANPVINTQSTYTITCAGVSKSVTVNVLPKIIEF